MSATITTTTKSLSSVTVDIPSLRCTLRDSYHYGTSPLTPLSSSTQLRTYLFGYPVAHSLAPPLLNALYGTLSYPWAYSLIESKDKSDLLSKLKQPDCIGATVTMPHKMTFMSEVDAVTDEALAIGAINTIFIRLDKSGTLARAAERPAPVVRGDGAYRSAVYALHTWLSVKRTYLINRLRSEVESIQASFDKVDGSQCGTCFVESREQAKTLEPPFFVVGTIPDFPPKDAGEIAARQATEELMGRPSIERGVVLEMCYHPKIRTAFYEASERFGWRFLAGTESMIWQGVAQQVLWTERERGEGDSGIEKAGKDVREAMAEHD